jgi:glycine/D-amino acid oxidase-like deaminating enzyme
MNCKPSPPCPSWTRSVKSTEGNIGEAEVALKAEGVPYATLDAKELEKKHHFRDLPSTYKGLFQKDGASINLKATARTLLDWNRESPQVTLRDEAPATAIEWRDGAFHVRTPHGTFAGKKLVLTPGPFANDVFGLLGFRVAATYWNMASAFYRKTKPDIQYPTWFVFQNAVGQNGNQFYGFPEVDWNHPGFIRVASDFVQKPLVSPKDRTLVPNPMELDFTARWVRDHMTGLDPVPHYTSTCLVALSRIANKELIVDFAPEHVPHHKDIVVYATGWAGKFVPLLGRILCDLALDGSTPFDISRFQAGRTYFHKTETELNP